MPAVEKPIAWENGSAARFRPLWLLLTLTALGVLLICLWQPLRHKSPYSVEWFQQENANVPGQAYIRLFAHNSPIQPQKSAANLPASWTVHIVLKEENGIGCNITSVLRCLLDENGHWTEQPMAGDFFQQHLRSGESIIGPNEFRRLSFYGVDDPPLVGIGLYIQGIDYDGHEVAFRAWFPFA